jgi:CRISPR-associated protein Cas2
MLIWLIYDISDNAVRTRTSEACKNHGLYRLQKSAFFGELEVNGLDALTKEIDSILDNDEYCNKDDSVFILPICKSCIHKRIIIGRVIDIKQYMEQEYIIVGQ